MEEALHSAAYYVALVLEALALLVIAIGAVEAIIGLLHAMARHTTS